MLCKIFAFAADKTRKQRRKEDDCRNNFARNIININSAQEIEKRAAKCPYKRNAAKYREYPSYSVPFGGDGDCFMHAKAINANGIAHEKLYTQNII